MIEILDHFPLFRTLCCIELSGRRILVTGWKFIKVYSLETHELIKNVSTQTVIKESLMTSDQKNVFLATENGLQQFSYPDFTLLNIHRPKFDVQCLTYHKSKERIIFNDKFQVFSLDIDSSIVLKCEDHHKDKILSIVSTSDEEVFFSTGRDKTLKVWKTNFCSLVMSVKLDFEGRSLLVKEDSDLIMVGMEYGFLSEFSLIDFSLIRTIKVVRNDITKIIQLTSGDVCISYLDGSICFPFGNDTLLKVFDKSLFSLTELKDGTIACCCEDGLKVVSLSTQEDLLNKTLDSASSGITSILSTLNSLSSNLRSIRKTSCDKKSQLISLLQHHLIQLRAPVENQPEKFSGLALSLLPDLKSIQRSHYFEGSREGKSRLLTRTYVLEMINSNSLISDSLESITLFDRKLKLQGKITNFKNPMDDFKIQLMSKGNWVFKMDNYIDFNHTHIYGLATVYFLNGYLNSYVLEGDVIIVSGFQSTLKVDGVIKKVSSVGNGGLIVTSDRKIYLLNFTTNTIEDYLKN